MTDRRLDVWVVGGNGQVHLARVADGMRWACEQGTGGPDIGDAVPGGPAPHGTCPLCTPAPQARAALPAGQR